MPVSHEMNNTVVACVDGSSSTQAVCKYAAWAASALKISVALLQFESYCDSTFYFLV